MAELITDHFWRLLGHWGRLDPNLQFTNFRYPYLRQPNPTANKKSR